MAEKSGAMDITVAIVTYNAAWCILPCLESLMQLVPHGGAIEVLVVDGCSDDGTQEAVQQFGPRIRLIENPGRTIASNRNVVLREARHPFIAFTDADCVVPSHWLHTLRCGWEETMQSDSRVAGVGGGNLPPGRNTHFHKALGIALNSFLGSLGSVQGRIFRSGRLVASLACLNVLYSRHALEEVGGFDENLANMCEDADINFRLRCQGNTLYFIPGADVKHCARHDLRSWLCNMFAYGVGRGRIMRKHRTFFSPAYACAAGFFPALVMVSLAGFFWPWAWLLWLYVPLIFGAGFWLAGRENSASAGRVAAILLGTHVCYAAGIWRGLVAGYPDSIR
ncbi:MAG: glycosyltransferase [Desulfuromonadaceae bacterium]|nr:glycosyltransferase [Desulfuromonadaceae bacterium]MDD5104092.1 glycosyltransferase [Desulfuromonadaceae bacterium]